MRKRSGSELLEKLLFYKDSLHIKLFVCLLGNRKEIVEEHKKFKMATEEFKNPTREFFYRFLNIIMIIPVILVIIFAVWYYVVPSRSTRIKE